jgi:hypothetical protein
MSRFEHFRLLISHLRVASDFEAALDKRQQVGRLRAMMALLQTQQKPAIELALRETCISLRTL